MNEWKLKHSYSLTSLTSRLPPSSSLFQPNGHGYYNYNRKEQRSPGGDDYGFLSSFSHISNNDISSGPKTTISSPAPKPALYSSYSTSRPQPPIPKPLPLRLSSSNLSSNQNHSSTLTTNQNHSSTLTNLSTNQNASSTLSTLSSNQNHSSILSLTPLAPSPLPNPSTSVRVRRTISCYVKHPAQKSLHSLGELYGSTSLLHSGQDWGSGPRNETNYMSTEGLSSKNSSSKYSTNLKSKVCSSEMWANNGELSGEIAGEGSSSLLSPPLSFANNRGSAFNPICEFSPYSSLSSSDLMRGISNGRRVFYHDGPADCGCQACFQVKLNIFQSTHGKKLGNGGLAPPTNPPPTNNNKELSESGVTNGTKNSLMTSSNVVNGTGGYKNLVIGENSDISWPLTPEEAVGYFSSRLTSWELSEIGKFPQIWCVGLDAVRKINGDKTNPLNSAFDDDNGNYHKVTRDHLAYRYEILEVIGKGSFGQVIRATDHKTQSQVAVKIIRNKKRFHAQALVEVKILEHLRKRDSENTVIRMYSSFYFRNHLCIVFELMSLNLYELVRRNHYQGFSTGLIRKFATALLKCLALLRRENIIHCDLKPENILLRKRGSSSIKVIDFGSSCFGHERVFSYIQSRFYRAPEVILGISYTPAIDIWSLGCVLAELATGYPLFPGENEVEQLGCIMETLGSPPESLITVASRRRLFFDSRNQARCLRNSKGRVRRPGSRDLGSSIKSTDLDFISFLRKCLTWDANDRITPEEGLNHPWITSATIQPTIVRKNYV